jgi:hypothetical protein
VPLVTVDLLRGRSQQQLGAISDAVHEAMVELLDVPVGSSSFRGQASYLEIPREEWR